MAAPINVGIAQPPGAGASPRRRNHRNGGSLRHEEIARFVDALRHAGCRVALDDFGAGHTTLRHLQTLAVGIVKIDGSFIQNLAVSPKIESSSAIWWG